MSADPDLPVDPNRYSGGHVIRNMWYNKTSSGMEVMNLWREVGSHEWNQWVVPPASENMSRKHPCFKLNDALLQCSDRQPDMMMLAGRCAVCNEDRKALMVCLTKNKAWKEPAATRPWYQLW